MPYNGSGAFAVINTFTPGTTISSSQTNSNNADFATGLSAVLVRDGQGPGMTGQFKAADGTVAAPGITFGADLDTGFWRANPNQMNGVANGENIFSVSTAGVTIAGGKTFTLSSPPSGNNDAATKQYVDTTLGAPSTTAMLFRNTNAPLGWTKDLTHNDKALRIVNGTIGAGGNVAFSTVFAKTATDGHAISIAQMPSHSHTVFQNVADAATGAGQNCVVALLSSGGNATDPTSSVGSNATHAHNMDIRVLYVDVIAAIKD